MIPDSAGNPRWDIDPCPAVGIQQLLTLPHAELFRIWSSLPAPALGELDGEYAGFLPTAGVPRESIQQTVRSFYQEESEIGYWLGKAFTRRDDASGEGYNVFRASAAGRPGYTYTRNGRYTSSVGPSLVDGRSSCLLCYESFDNHAGRSGLVDEIRQYSKGLYLGTATRQAPDGRRTEANECFLIAGPFNPWIGPDDSG
jgi:hypothetical protein